MDNSGSKEVFTTEDSQPKFLSLSQLRQQIKAARKTAKASNGSTEKLESQTNFGIPEVKIDDNGDFEYQIYEVSALKQELLEFFCPEALCDSISFDQLFFNQHKIDFGKIFDFKEEISVKVGCDDSITDGKVLPDSAEKRYDMIAKILPQLTNNSDDIPALIARLGQVLVIKQLVLFPSSEQLCSKNIEADDYVRFMESLHLRQILVKCPKFLGIISNIISQDWKSMKSQIDRFDGNEKLLLINLSTLEEILGICYSFIVSIRHHSDTHQLDKEGIEKLLNMLILVVIDIFDKNNILNHKLSHFNNFPLKKILLTIWKLMLLLFPPSKKGSYLLGSKLSSERDIYHELAKNSCKGIWPFHSANSELSSRLKYQKPPSYADEESLNQPKEWTRPNRNCPQQRPKIDVWEYQQTLDDLQAKYVGFSENNLGKDFAHYRKIMDKILAYHPFSPPSELSQNDHHMSKAVFTSFPDPIKEVLDSLNYNLYISKADMEIADEFLKMRIWDSGLELGENIFLSSRDGDSENDSPAIQAAKKRIELLTRIMQKNSTLLQPSETVEKSKYIPSRPLNYNFQNFLAEFPYSIDGCKRFIVLYLKILLFCGISGPVKPSETRNSPIIEQMLEFKGSTPDDNTDKITLMEKEITCKAVSHSILLFLQEAKKMNACCFEYFCSLLVDSNFLVLALKVINREHVQDAIRGINMQRVFQKNTQDCPGDKLAAYMAIHPALYSTSNLLRILQKLSKRKPSRIAALLKLSSPALLKKLLRHEVVFWDNYIYRIFHNLMPYLTRTWKQSNMKIISGIFLRLRPYVSSWLSNGKDGPQTINNRDELEYQESLWRSVGVFYMCRCYPFDMAKELMLNFGIDSVELSQFSSNQVREWIESEPVQLDEDFLENYDIWLANEVFNEITI